MFYSWKRISCCGMFDCPLSIISKFLQRVPLQSVSPGLGPCLACRFAPRSTEIWENEMPTRKRHSLHPHTIQAVSGSPPLLSPRVGLPAFVKPYFYMLNKCLAVLDKADLGGQLPESLALHVQAVLADQTASTLVTGDTAATTALAVVLGVAVPHSCTGKNHGTNSQNFRIMLQTGPQRRPCRARNLPSCAILLLLKLLANFNVKRTPPARHMRNKGEIRGLGTVSPFLSECPPTLSQFHHPLH